MSGTTPDSISYPTQQYGLLGPTPTDYFDAIEAGAIGDGIADDTLPLQAALDAAEYGGGGVVYLPGNGRRYKITSTLLIGSNTTLAADGSARLLAAPSDLWTVNPEAMYFDPTDFATMLANRASGAYPTPPETRNSGITVRGLVFDYSELGSGAAGTGNGIQFLFVDNVLIESCEFIAGPNATADPGRVADGMAVLDCANVTVRGCRAYWFRNCAYDFWSSPTNILIEDCYAETYDGLQLVNFNPDAEPSAGGYRPDLVASGFTMRNCTLVGLGDSATPIQIERLSVSSTDCYVENVLIQGCTFTNSFPVMRGDIRGLIVTDNHFSGYPAENTNVIRIYPQYGGTATGVVLEGNVILDPGTIAGQGGVIVCDTGTNPAVVTGNTITGTTYTGDAFGQGTSGRPNQYGNYFEKPGITGRMHQGFIFTNPNTVADAPRACIGWEDTGENILRMYMQGNFFEFWSTLSDGLPRQVWSIEGLNSTQAFQFLVPLRVAGLFRKSLASGLTATGLTQPGAYPLAENYSEFTTVAAGTGAILPSNAPASITGLEMTVWNQGANVLNVYPPTGAQIDALGTDIADTIAVGANKTYVGITATQYRIKSG